MTAPLKITVGLDNEAPSRLAVDWAIRLASRRPARISLVTAFDMMLTDPFDDEGLLESERARILAAVPGVTVDVALADGSVPETLHRYGDRSDLLVIGSHRTRHWQSVMSGNLPVRMASSSSCPIVVVPDDWEPRDGAIVAGLDDDASSDAAVEWAADFAVSMGRELHLFHTWLRPMPPADPVNLYVNLPRELQELHRDRLASVARVVRARHPRLHVREDLYEGGTDSGLIAASSPAELMVVGSHRRGPLAGLVLGSTAGDLIRHAHAPVCVVPPRRDVPKGTPTTFEEAWA